MARKDGKLDERAARAEEVEEIRIRTKIFRNKNQERVNAVIK